MKYNGWYIETNGKFFRPYRRIARTKGLFKKRRVYERDYIWTYSHWGYDTAIEKVKEFETLEDAKNGIDEENFKKHGRHQWQSA